MAGGHAVIDRRMLEVRRTLFDNGTVSYDGEHDGKPWRLTFRRKGTMRLHLPGGFMRVYRTMYGKNEPWTNVDLGPARK